MTAQGAAVSKLVIFFDFAAVFVVFLFLLSTEYDELRFPFQPGMSE